MRIIRRTDERQQARNNPKMDTQMKVDKVEYIAVKETAKVTKTGKEVKRESKFIFRVRSGGQWYLCRELQDENLRPFADVFSRENAIIRFPELFKALGLNVPDAVKMSASEAVKKVEEREAKREARERETLENGRNKFMKHNAENGAKRWYRLCEKYGVEG